MKATLLSLFLALLMVGCAANSGIVDMHNGTYMVTKQAATGFSGSGNLKAMAIEEARLFCESKSMSMKIISVTEAEPPYVFGNFPKAEVVFKALPKNSIELNQSTDYISDHPRIKIQENPNKIPQVRHNETKSRESVYQALLKLNELKQKGILNDQEFEQEKARLLKLN